VCLQDGYKLIRADQLLAAFSAFDRQQITFRAFRAYFGCHELVARREAAERSSRVTSRTHQRRFRSDELHELVERGEGRPITRELKALKASGLLNFTESAIEIAASASVSAEQLGLVGTRGTRRLIPVPRQVLKFLATCSRPALAKTVVAYLLRGLALDRSGQLRHKGTVKISWICELCRISERAARAARAELIRLGWITKDTGSVQRKLNRDGAYFVINTAWRRVLKQSAPLGAQKSPQFAPPREKQETPSDLKNQKPALRPGSGVLGTERKPDLRNIEPDDIKRLSRLRELFRQATEAGWIERGEAAFLNFTSAAVRATRAPGDSVRIFVGIVRGRLWHFITQEQEARAAEIIRRNREWKTQVPLLSSGSVTIDLSGLLKNSDSCRFHTDSLSGASGLVCSGVHGSGELGKHVPCQTS
jgi:hypothetical protein